jgi:hypothetical protein
MNYMPILLLFFKLAIMLILALNTTLFCKCKITIGVSNPLWAAQKPDRKGRALAWYTRTDSALRAPPLKHARSKLLRVFSLRRTAFGGAIRWRE